MYKHTAELNAKAVECLTEGTYDDAAKMLKQALAKLQTSFGAASTRIRNYDKGTATNVSLVSVPVLTPEQAEEITHEQGSLFSLFPKAFQFEYSSNDHDEEEDLVFSHLLVVLIFNLALATHLKSIQEKTLTQKRLMQILNLYQNGLHLAETFFSIEDRLSMLSVQLALVNNQGFVFSQGHWFAETRERLASLIELLELAACETTQVSMDDYQILFGSICVFLEGNDLCLAPAA